MRDYQPVALGKFCNVTTEFLESKGRPWTGLQQRHGLPLLVGTRGGRGKSLIGFHGKGGHRRAVTIPLRTKARHVIVAHTLIDSRIMDGEPVGQAVAHYVFTYADRSAERVPIRDRFEIGALPLTWGQLPFLALPDEPNQLYPRDKIDVGLSGNHQTEGIQGWLRGYWLWAWVNPRPDVKLVSLSVEPTDRKFVVAAVTLGHLAEYPFLTTARREVKITLPRKADAAQSSPLEVEVDRGVRGYAQPLPATSAAAFLNDPLTGWGQSNNPASSPAYVHIAATPSATVTVKQNGKPLGKARWSELERKGKVKLPRLELELLDRGRNWVHTTVLDDATGKPVPCRLHFRSIAGVPHQPHGHHDHLNTNYGTWHTDIGGDLRLGQATYAYTDGTAQGWLPRGKVIVDVARGYEYEPLRQIVEIKPGQRELMLRIKRWTDMNAQGWYSGDTHVHFLGERGAHREAMGEDLNVVNLLASQWGNLFTNTEDFIGRPTTSSDGKTIVYCSQENRQHMLGHLTLLGLKKQVAPWCTDGLGEAEVGGNLETTLSHWADACHDQGGTVVIPHLPNPNGEPATLIATGRADAVEMLIHRSYDHQEYYRYLNGGYRLPLVGGTDKMDAGVPVGLCRTYVHLDRNEPFTYDQWCKSMRAGRTFLSSGPMLHFTVNGARVGDTLTLTGNGGTVEVEAAAESIFPIHVLQIISEGNVVAETRERKGARVLRLKARLPVRGNTWLAARCASSRSPAGRNAYFDSTLHHDTWNRGIFAHSSPIYVATGGPWKMFSLATSQYMLTLIDGSLEYIRRHGRQFNLTDDVTHHHTHTDHQAFLESPFHQASAAIHRRMHEMGLPH